jgi:hypothetical protein
VASTNELACADTVYRSVTEGADMFPSDSGCMGMRTILKQAQMMLLADCFNRRDIDRVAEEVSNDDNFRSSGDGAFDCFRGYRWIVR